MPEHDDHEHDLGLHHDLATLAARRATDRSRMSRRGALTLLGAGGVGLLVAACGGSGSDSASSTTASSAPDGGSSSTTAGGTATTGGAAVDAPGAIPEETAGPYPGDGSQGANAPNVLDDSGVVRSDLRSSFGGMTGQASGLTTTVALTILDAATGAPREGAALYLWHCDMEGGYSLYSPGLTDQNYLRGVQAADADGALELTTIFPGAYSGRWPHLHLEVFPDLASITTSRSKLVTSQIALPEDVCRQVYTAVDGYEQSLANLGRTSLAGDMVFRDGSSRQVATASGDQVNGIRLALALAV